MEVDRGLKIVLNANSLIFRSSQSMTGVCKRSFCDDEATILLVLETFYCFGVLISKPLRQSSSLDAQKVLKIATEGNAHALEQPYMNSRGVTNTVECS